MSIVSFSKRLFLYVSLGKFIPATQRPDGTWRKARRVKDGYVPQDEVPLYESKAKKIQAQRPNNNSLPVGMCPLVAQAVKEKQEKQLKKQKQKEQQQQQQLQQQQLQQQKAKVNPTPGLLHVTSKFEPVKKPKNASQQESSKPEQVPVTNDVVNEITDKVNDLAVMDERQEVSKKLKKLRKKLREIEEIEQKINSGELSKPEKDQLDKVARKSEILNEIQEFSRKLVK